MSIRPAITPNLIAVLADEAPKRLIRKLDKAPELAETWSWNVTPDLVSVETDRGETVTLSPVDAKLLQLDQISCTCLLAPRCLHLLAVITRLPIDDGSDLGPGNDRHSDDPSDDHFVRSAGVKAEIGNADDHKPLLPGIIEDQLALSPEQRRVTRLAWRVAAQVLEVGASSAGTVLQAELYRIVHACRASRLHRLARATLRVAKAIRNLRESRAEFSVTDLSNKVREMLWVSAVLSGRRTDPVAIGRGSVMSGQGSVQNRPAEKEPPTPRTIAFRWVGTARRAYRDIGGLRLYGLFTEPIVAATGYAGVVTYLCDDDARIFSVSDVKPGDATRAPAAHDAGVRLGEVSISHRELARAGLFLQNATMSNDGRLGSGKQVKAVRAKATSWSDDSVQMLFAESMDTQLQRAFLALELQDVDRPAGWDLLFMNGTIMGATEHALVVAVNSNGDGPDPIGPDPIDEVPRLVFCELRTDLEVLFDRANLGLLAHAPGLRLSFVGRIQFGLPRTVSLLSCGLPRTPDSANATTAPADIASPRLELPSAWSGRFSMGLEKLEAGYFELGDNRAQAPAEFEPPPAKVPDPLISFRRRLTRMVIGGRDTILAAVTPRIERESGQLVRRLMPTGAMLLENLAGAATGLRRTQSGQRQFDSSEVLGEAWLDAAIYDTAARHALQRLSWL